MHSFVTENDSWQHAAHNSKQQEYKKNVSDSVGAPVGGMHFIISVAAANCFFFPLAGMCKQR